MSIRVNFYKVTSLPTNPVPDSLYFVKDGNFSETYLTTTSGVATPVGNSAMINRLLADYVDDILGSLNVITIVSTIQERNDLPKDKDRVVLVKGASSTKAVMYFYDKLKNSWEKINEYVGDGTSQEQSWSTVEW